MNNVNIHFTGFSHDKLSAERGRIIETIQSELANLQALFAYEEPIEISIKESKENTIPHLGTGGYTPSSELIELSLDENHTAWGNEIFLKNIKQTIVHEFNHVVRWASVSYGMTLIESLISEGIATAFEKDYCEVSVPWGTYSTDDLVLFQKITKEVPVEIWQSEHDHFKWLFGNDEIPTFFGYRLGTYIAETYKKQNPNISWSQITRTPYKEILSVQNIVNNM